MSRAQELRHNFQGRMAELKTLRDQVRLDLHLASMELRDEWKKLEKRMPDPSLASDQLREITTESVDKLATELARFRDRLLGGQRRPVTTCMTTAVATCAASDSMAHAVGLMWDRDVGCLPVVDSAQNLLGMITDRDAAIASWSRGLRLEDITVGSAMSKTVLSCAASDDVRTALTVMRTQQIRRLPIVAENGRLVGLVTLGDIARGLERDGTTGYVGASEVVDTLVGILTAPTERSASAN